MTEHNVDDVTDITRVTVPSTYTNEMRMSGEGGKRVDRNMKNDSDTVFYPSKFFMNDDKS